MSFLLLIADLELRGENNLPCVQQNATARTVMTIRVVGMMMMMMMTMMTDSVGAF